MGAFGSWLLSIVGVIFIGVFIDIILPEGQTNKYIKCVFAFIIILVIIMPLKNINNVRTVFDDFFNNYTMELDENFIFNINQKKIEQLCENIETNAEQQGLYNVDVQILSNIYEYELDITGVNIFLDNLVIDEKAEHIDKYQTLQQIVMIYINIDKEKIVFCE